jgi:RNA polymerase sigma-70 factor, ECF subfamily
VPEPVAAATTEQRSILGTAVAEVLSEVDAEDRFLLASYYLDQRTLLQIARLLRVHEATVSRKLKRLTAELRKQLMRRLQRGGMSKRAAEEMLETDPRDLEINLRKVLQESQTDTFLEKTET